VKLFCVVDQLIESGDTEKAAQLTIIAPVRAILRMSDSPLNEITGRLVVVSADATIPSRTAACVADGGSGHAGTVDHDHTRPATHTGLRDNTVWLRYWRGRHCLRSGSESQPEHNNSYRFDHCFLPEVQNSLLCGLLGSPLAGVAQDREFARYRHNSKAMTVSGDPARRVLHLSICWSR
jgi:hypothetical protein